MKLFTHLFFFSILLSSTLFSSVAFAQTLTVQQQNEIKHLLTFVENTRCKYERNGSFYNGKQAKAHIIMANKLKLTFKRSMIIMLMTLIQQKVLFNTLPQKVKCRVNHIKSIVLMLKQLPVKNGY